MKQEAAQQIIDQAGQIQDIIAVVDASNAARYSKGGGYRVRLTHRKLQRRITIYDARQWESIKLAWREAS